MPELPNLLVCSLFHLVKAKARKTKPSAFAGDVQLTELPDSPENLYMWPLSCPHRFCERKTVRDFTAHAGVTLLRLKNARHHNKNVALL